MLVIGAELVSVVVQRWNLAVVRDDDHVGAVEGVFFPVLVQNFTDALIGNDLQVANLTREGIFGDVGENIDAGKIDDLQVGDAFRLDRFDQFLRGAQIESGGNRLLRIDPFQSTLDKKAKKVRQ